MFELCARQYSEDGGEQATAHGLSYQIDVKGDAGAEGDGEAAAQAEEEEGGGTVAAASAPEAAPDGGGAAGGEGDNPEVKEKEKEPDAAAQQGGDAAAADAPGSQQADLMAEILSRGGYVEKKSESFQQREESAALRHFVGGIGNTSKSDFMAHWRQFGEVVDADVRLTPDGRGRGFGFITFATKEGSNAALASTVHEVNGEKWEIKAGEATHRVNTQLDPSRVESTLVFQPP